MGTPSREGDSATIAIAVIAVAARLVLPLRISRAAFIPPPLHVARHERPAPIVAIDESDALTAQLLGLDDVEIAGPRVLLDHHGYAVRRVGLDALGPRRHVA